MKSIPIIFLLSFCISASQAQTSKCKTIVRANKHKILAYDDIEISNVTWLYRGMAITRTGDSISVKNGGARVAQFKLNNVHIEGNNYTEYYPNGTIKMIDSLEQSTRWLMKRYWGEFYGSVIHTKKYNTDGLLQQITYYTPNGRDSLTQKWYPNGQIQQSIWGDKKWGTDSSAHTWDEKGILTSIKTRTFFKEFYPSGILKMLTTDTTISDRSVECKKAYYPTGTIQSVAYYFNEIPCETWLYYTEKGKLYKTVKEADITSIPNDGTMQYDVVSDIFSREIIEPEFLGNKPFYKYINEKIIDVVCNSTLPLANVYKIKFTVDSEGKAIFESMTGQNHTAILETIKQTIEQMPAWKPAEKNGESIQTGLILKLYLKNIK